ncbi:MAG: ribonuclease J [Chthonomonadales bacterium]|nr:ribonuclease J [Chthonomonadales bacterium]
MREVRDLPEETETPTPLEIIPLGGAAEVGKNMIAVRYGDDIVVIDAGVAFPTEEHPGVDLIIPDFTYLTENADQVRAVCLTHGHEDHIGALPYLLKELNVPVFGTPLTIGLVRVKLDEHKLLGEARLHTYVPGEQVAFGAITVEPIRVTHSIPDTVSLALFTPVGTVVHTGDFKVDHTPVDGRMFDAARFAELGDAGVMLLLSDTVNVEQAGWVPSERVVGRVFEQHFREAPGRVLVTTFASNIHRVQLLLDAAAASGRKVAVAGRSMSRNIEVARELGFLRYSDDIRVRVEEIREYPPNEIAILTTGSQGEPLSALSRMACDDHKIQIQPGDTVVLSSKPIPGNEDAVWRTVNRLFRRGARVVYNLLTPVHVSGHGNQEELKLMYSLTRPLYAVPFHGEPRMMYAYTEMVAAMGMPRERVLWLENGYRLALDGTDARLLEPIGTAGSILVDHLSESGVADFVIRDRRHLASEGTVIVTVALDRAAGEVLSGPDLISRGFLHPEDSESLFEEAAGRVREALAEMSSADEQDWDNMRTLVRDVVARFLRKKTGRRPVIVPVVMVI